MVGVRITNTAWGEATQLLEEAFINPSLLFFSEIRTLRVVCAPIDRVHRQAHASAPAAAAHGGLGA